MHKLWIVLSAIIGYVAAFIIPIIRGICVVFTTNDMIGVGFGIILFGSALWGIIYYIGIFFTILPQIMANIPKWWRSRVEYKRKLENGDVSAYLKKYEEIIKVCVLTVLVVAITVALLVGLSLLLGYIHSLMVC